MNAALYALIADLCAKSPDLTAADWNPSDKDWYAFHDAVLEFHNKAMNILADAGTNGLGHLDRLIADAIDDKFRQVVDRLKERAQG